MKYSFRSTRYKVDYSNGTESYFNFIIEYNGGKPTGQFFSGYTSYTNDDLFPKAVPQFFKSVEKIHSDGGVGTIMLFTFAQGAPIESAKHRLDTFEKGSDTYKFRYTVIEVEGGEKNDEIKSVSYESAVVPSGD